MPSGSFSLGGTWIMPSLARLAPDSAPVTSLLAAGGGGVAADRRGFDRDRCQPLPAGAGAGLFCDCCPIGVGEVIDGVTCSGVAGLVSTGGGGACGAGALDEFSIACGDGGALPPSSRFIAILKVPSTITTTLAPTSSERIFEVMVERSWPVLGAACDGAALTLALPWRRGRLFRGCAAAACAARRAAAMKLDDDTGSFGAAGISLIALSDAAMRSDGVAAAAVRPRARLERMIRAAVRARSRRAAAPCAARGFR